VFSILFFSALASQPSKLPSDIIVGKQAYQAYCWVCHGEKADGNGPQAAQLQVSPPALLPLVSNKSILLDDPLIDTVLKGKGYMPAYDQLLDRQEVRRILFYLQDMSSDLEEEKKKGKKEEKQKENKENILTPPAQKEER
jgi:mono/diheme cytochrome c family protein